MTTETPQIVVRLADGEERPAETYPDESYNCPFCGAAVSREGVIWDREVWDRRGCANPACTVNMSTEELAAKRARDAEREAVQASGDALATALLQAVDERREREAGLWAELKTRAEQDGCCLRCLWRSRWSVGEPTFRRHRTADYHQGR